MDNKEALFYSLHLRLLKQQTQQTQQTEQTEQTEQTDQSAGHGVEVIALPEGPGEPRLAQFEHWELLSHRLSAVASSTPFHLKVLSRTLHAGLTACVIDRATGLRQIFSLNQLKDLGVAK